MSDRQDLDKCAADAAASLKTPEEQADEQFDTGESVRAMRARDAHVASVIRAAMASGNDGTVGGAQRAYVAVEAILCKLEGKAL